MAKPALPRDANHNPVHLVPAKAALSVTNDETISSATSVSVHSDAGFIEVNAVDSGIFLKYAAGASSSDFDEYIIANTVRHYFIPSGVTVLSVIEDTTNAKVRIIQK